MVTDRDIYGYIGGSDANRIYGSYDTATFANFWQERTTGIKLNQFDTVDTAAGNVMEYKILDHLGIDQKYRDVFMSKEGCIAGINTDALTEDTYHEIKTALPEIAYKWISGKAISASYLRQIMHGLYVTDRKLAKLHVCAMTRAEKRCPFGIDLSGRIFTFDFSVEDFDLEEHHRRIMYLTKCFSEKAKPTDIGLQRFKN